MDWTLILAFFLIIFIHYYFPPLVMLVVQSNSIGNVQFISVSL
jgi:hypothetical protein